MGKLSQADGLINVMTGLGTARSKRSWNQWSPSLLSTGWQELEAAYQDSWICRQIVDVPAEDMCREWREIKSDYAEEIKQEEMRLNVMGLVQESLSWARLFGGAALLMITDQDLTKPFDPRRIKKGGLKRLLCIDRWDLSAISINTWDIMAENYLSPEFFIVRGGNLQVHHSHFVKFPGSRLTRRMMAYTMGWGDSTLRKCLEDINDTVSAKMGIAELMHEANVDVIRREGLNDALASDEDEDIIKAYTAFGMMKGNIKLSLLDKLDEYTRNPLSLAGVSDTLEQLQIWISGAARIPYTKLFGTSAKGMNATGEGDMKTYYDNIRSEQQHIDPMMRQLDEVLVRSATGTFPEDYDYEWRPLSQPDVVETAQAQLLNAQRDVAYKDGGIVQTYQVQRELMSKDVYQFDSADIDELEKVTKESGILSELDLADPDVGEPEQQSETESFTDRYQAHMDAGLSHDEAMKKLAP